MNYLRHVISSKGWMHVPRRLCMIARRFGVTSARSRRALHRFLDITGAHDCRPTLFITADLLRCHRSTIQSVLARNVDVGLHGHHHIDHSLIPSDLQLREIAAGISRFQEVGVQVSGFRAPFLRFNRSTCEAVVANKLSWLSNTVMRYKEFGGADPIGHSKCWQTLREFYTHKPFTREPCLPYWDREAHCLEIPILVPDDEMLIDRLGIRDESKIADIWMEMLQFSHEHGELCNLLIHPERVHIVAKPLNTALKRARDLGDVWIASLAEIGHWWHERARASVEVRESGNGAYRVTVNGPEALAVSIQHPGGRSESVTLGKEHSFALRSEFRPAIAIPASCDDSMRACLTNEGFVVESNNDPSRCSITLSNHPADSNRLLLESLHQARGPLVRLGRWPSGYRSALAVTADVDAITLWDFVRRARHFDTLGWSKTPISMLCLSLLPYALDLMPYWEM